MLEVEGLEVAYGDLQVVWGVSFRVDRDSIVAILGPNGAGKTTTLLAVMGLLPAKAGSVRFEGEELIGLPTHQIVDRGVVMMPEERAAFQSLTVAEHLEVGAYTPRARAEYEETIGGVCEICPGAAERRKQSAAT